MSLFAGARDPESVELVITDASFDFTVVIGVELLTVLAGGVAVEWAWSITSAAIGSLHLRHIFDAAGGDINVAGTYKVYGNLLTGGLPRRIVPASFPVLAYP